MLLLPAFLLPVPFLATVLLVNNTLYSYNHRLFLDIRIKSPTAPFLHGLYEK